MENGGKLGIVLGKSEEKASCLQVSHRSGADIKLTGEWGSR